MVNPEYADRDKHRTETFVVDGMLEMVTRATTLATFTFAPGVKFWVTLCSGSVGDHQRCHFGGSVFLPILQLRIDWRVTVGKHLHHITCIDDDDDILRIAQLCLEHMGGFHVSCFDNPRNAIDIVARAVPDFILLDVMMPDMDGLRTLDCLRASIRLHDTPIVFMSARVRPDEIADYKSRGANGVIAKPFDPSLLTQQVSQIWSDFHMEHA